MRKIYFLLFIMVISASFSSCKKNDAEAKPTVLDITGNWKLTALSSEYIFGTQSVVTLSNQAISDYVDHIYYKADGTGTMSVNGIAIRKFSYVADDSIIHFTNVKDIPSNEVVGTGAFVSYITKSNGAELEMTDKVYSYGVTFYINDRYDQLQRHITLVKE